MYAVYYGKKRVFPHDETLEPGGIYEINVGTMPHGGFLVKVESDRWGSVYLAYQTTWDIWEDWSPYSGRVID